MDNMLRIQQLYGEGKLEFNPQFSDGDYVRMCVDCRNLSPNPIYFEVDRFEYRQRGNDACMEKLNEVLLEDESIILS